jgi:8-oxo-dGTP diphosphatase
MSKTNEKNSVMMENRINIFTVEKGKLKILLQRKTKDPYKGYWELPGKMLDKEKTLEENTDEILEETISTKNVYKEQNYTFSGLDRYPNERVIATSYIALTDEKTVKLKGSEEVEDIAWFDIKELPKIAFDHKEIMDKARTQLKEKLTNTTVLKNLFPADFTLPEIQNIFESIMNIKLDRRNFRKKFINLGLIEETGYNNVGGSGRPAKLYRFKENIKDTNLF